MSVNLKKGQKVELKKQNGGELQRVVVALGWDEAQGNGSGFLSNLLGGKKQDIDCDASAFVCVNGRIVNKNDIVYFGNLTHKTNFLFGKLFQNFEAKSFPFWTTFIFSRVHPRVH